jgi:hypothetical protein
MLYNRSTGKKLPVLEQVYSLDNFVNWLEQQPQVKKFEYVDPRGCLIYQYLVEMGIPVNYVVPTGYTLQGDITRTEISYPYIFNYISVISGNSYHTALVKAREELKASRS